MRISDWSSDVCSSDLDEHGPADARTGHDNVIAALYRLVAGWFDRFLCMCGARKAREHGDSEKRCRKVEFAASGRGCPSLDHVFFSALNPAKAVSSPVSPRVQPVYGPADILPNAGSTSTRSCRVGRVCVDFLRVGEIGRAWLMEKEW